MSSAVRVLSESRDDLSIQSGLSSACAYNGSKFYYGRPIFASGDKTRMEIRNRLQKTYTRVHLREQPSDFAYWQTQPYQVRLATLEQIRQEYHRWRYNAEPRFQRVYHIVKR